VRIVAELKRGLDMDTVVLGSGDLLQTLMHHHVIDRFIVLITRSSSGPAAVRARRR
jgi:dihydrofolate reductase